jgi:hypothetical protein
MYSSHHLSLMLIALMQEMGQLPRFDDIDTDKLHDKIYDDINLISK